MSDTAVKLNHRRFRALLKKFRRKRIRQKAAQERLLNGGQPEEEEPSQEEREAQERERQRQHKLWLEREAEAQRQLASHRRVQALPPAELSKEDSLKQVLAQLPELLAGASGAPGEPDAAPAGLVRARVAGAPARGHG